jgi:hypothetical protein
MFLYHYLSCLLIRPSLSHTPKDTNDPMDDEYTESELQMVMMLLSGEWV